MRNLLVLLGVMMALLSCENGGSKQMLYDVENYMEEHPDSALAVLKTIDPENLVSKKDKAYYSLMMSMALDKNYVDRTDFEVIGPALDYYLYKGSKRYRFLTLYYAGAINQNAGDNESAMDCFVEAERYVRYATDLQKARLYVLQTLIYTDAFVYDKAIAAAEKSAELFYNENDTVKYVRALYRKALSQVAMKDYDGSMITVEQVSPYLPYLPVKAQAQYYNTNICRCEFADKDSLHAIINEYISSIPESYIDWLTIADAYARTDSSEQALRYLRKYRENTNSNYEEDPKYHWINARANELAGNDKASISSYRRYHELVDALNLKIVQSRTGYIKERHENELARVKSRATMAILSLLLVIACLSGYIIARQIHRELKRKKLENRELSDLYASISQEKAALERVLAKERVAAVDRSLLSERLRLLDGISAGMISSSIGEDQAMTSLKALVNDRERFVQSTVQSMSVSCPEFMQYLKQHGLTDKETGVCCLLCIGLNISEVGAYMNSRSIYNVTGAIRTKLNIPKTKHNLDHYLRRRMLSSQSL